MQLVFQLNEAIHALVSLMKRTTSNGDPKVERLTSCSGAITARRHKRHLRTRSVNVTRVAVAGVISWRHCLATERGRRHDCLGNIQAVARTGGQNKRVPLITHIMQPPRDVYDSPVGGTVWQASNGLECGPVWLWEPADTIVRRWQNQRVSNMPLLKANDITIPNPIPVTITHVEK